MNYSKEQLTEARRQIDSTVHKLRQTVLTLEAKGDPVRYRSQLTLAGGRIDAFYEHTLQPWDYAAGAIIVRGAHGTVEAMTEHALDELQPTGILASNGSCHAALRDIVCRFL